MVEEELDGQPVLAHDDVTPVGPKVNTGEPKDLTPQEVKKWMQRIRRERRRMLPYHRHWRKTIGMYTATDPIKRRADDSIPEVLVNLIPSTVSLLANRLWGRERKIFGSTDNQEVELEIVGIQGQLRRRWTRLDPFRQVRRVITDCLLTGVGVVKMGYSTEFGGSAFSAKDGRNLETNDMMEEGSPWLQRVSPFRLFVDPNAVDLEDADWIAIEFRRPLHEVRKNPKYQNVSRIRASANDETDSQEKNEKERGEEPFVRLYEVQDKVTRTTFILAEGLEKKTVVPPGQIELPFKGFSVEVLRFNEVPDTFWGLSEVGMWADQQRELSDLRSTISDFMKRWSWIWLVRKGAADEDQLEKLTQAEPQSYVEVDEPEAIQPLQSPALSADFGAVNQMYMDDINKLSGIADFARGSVSGAKTATEVNAIQTESAGRGNAMSDMTLDFMNRVLHKYAAIEVRLNLLPGEEFPLEDIEWRFDVPTLKNTDPQIRRKLFTDLYNMVMPIAMQVPDMIAPRELTARLFMEYELTDLEDLLPEPPSPGSGLTPGQENLLLMAGEQIEPSDDEDFEGHVAEHQALFEFPQVRDGEVPEATVSIIAHLEATREKARQQGIDLEIPILDAIEQANTQGQGQGQPTTSPMDSRAIGGPGPTFASLATTSSS